MTHPSGPGAAAPPQSVESITKIAQDYEYNSSIPLRYWLRTATTLVREADIYEREGRDEQVYLLLFRHAQLVLVNLSSHPDAKDDKTRKALVEAEKEVQKNLAKLEVLKPRINKRYERYSQLIKDRQARKQSAAQHPISEQRDGVPDPALAGVVEPLEAGKNRDLAVRLAQSEIHRRATIRRSKEPPGDVGDNKRVAGVWGDWEDALKTDSTSADRDLSRRIQHLRNNIDHTSTDHRHHVQDSSAARTASSSTAYKYPTVPRQKPLEPISAGRIAIYDKNAERQPPPILPPKEQIVEPSRASIVDGSLEPSPPLPPSKLSPVPLVPQKVQPPDATTSARLDLDPSSYTFKPSAYLENGTPLRSVFLPANLRSRFLSVASSNTRRNLETCAILCGTLVSNALFISRLLIPEQTSTPDTCETVNESAIFDYCDSEDLMVLGWIHTHPSQTCFMSSRDLHTHCGYQVMLPESIAIVCAPSKDPSWGVFRLTDPPGLKTVLNCTQTGLFHPHSQENIYTGALRPGHVVEANGLEFETVDLRPASQR